MLLLLIVIFKFQMTYLCFIVFSRKSSNSPKQNKIYILNYTLNEINCTNNYIIQVLLIECKFNAFYTMIIIIFHSFISLNISTIFDPYGFSNQCALQMHNTILKTSFSVIILKQYYCLLSLIEFFSRKITTNITNSLFTEDQNLYNNYIFIEKC